jgi:hypothetical protein
MVISIIEREKRILNLPGFAWTWEKCERGPDEAPAADACQLSGGVNQERSSSAAEPVGYVGENAVDLTANQGQSRNRHQGRKGDDRRVLAQPLPLSSLRRYPGCTSSRLFLIPAETGSGLQTSGYRQGGRTAPPLPKPLMRSAKNVIRQPRRVNW